MELQINEALCFFVHSAEVLLLLHTLYAVCKEYFRITDTR